VSFFKYKSVRLAARRSRCFPSFAQGVSEDVKSPQSAESSSVSVDGSTVGSRAGLTMDPAGGGGRRNPPPEGFEEAVAFLEMEWLWFLTATWIFSPSLRERSRSGRRVVPWLPEMSSVALSTSFAISSAALILST
jgi:hypothetical protein